MYILLEYAQNKNKQLILPIRLAELVMYYVLCIRLSPSHTELQFNAPPTPPPPPELDLVRLSFLSWAQRREFAMQ